MFNLNKFIKEVHENAVNHGWHEDKRTFGDIASLITCEVSEAVEEHRNGKPMIYVNKHTEQSDADGGYNYIETDVAYFDGLKPEGILVELADVIIRILDYAASLGDDTYKEIGMDFTQILELKHNYNKTRSYKHGGKLI